MTFLRRYLWVGAMGMGLVFLALGVFFVVKGFDAKATIRAALEDERVTTSEDAVQFGVPGGVPVVDAKTAQAQADVIKMHSILRWGRNTEMARDDPNRANYITGLTLRNALGLAVLGFGVADLAIGTGAVVILLGATMIAVGVPALYWAKEAERKVVQEVSRRVTAKAPGLS